MNDELKIALSVIVPVYNKKIYLENLFQCICNQTFSEFECIVIDDGSTDGSSEMCDEIAKYDDRFQIYHIPNSGVSHARNMGLKMARGEFITFIDADDRVGPEYLEGLYFEIVENKSDMVICSVEKTWISGRRKKINLPRIGKIPMSDVLQDFAKWQKATGIYGYCCGKLIPKKIIENNWFDEKTSLAEDFEFGLKIYPKVKYISFISQPTYYYLQEACNSSGIVADCEIDYRKQLDINLQYKSFLTDENVYHGENCKIVSQQISNYIYYTLFYCQLNNFNECFKELRVLYIKNNMELLGRNKMEKLLFLLFRHDCMCLTKLNLILYRLMRRMVRRR